MSAMPSQSKSAAFALRDVKEADREAMLDLWVEAWREAMPAIDFDQRREWLRVHLTQLERLGFVMRCVTGPRERVLGFVDAGVLERDQRGIERFCISWGKHLFNSQ